MGQVPNNLVQLFSARLAPLQISWPFFHVPIEMILMDYALVDEVIRPREKKSNAAPPGTLQPADKLVYLDSGQFFYDADESAALTPSPFLNNNYITFGVCAEPLQISKESVACWSEILKQVPDAQLKIYHHCFPALICEQHLLRQFSEQGIDENRIAFAPSDDSFSARFEKFSEIDILLSPFPVTDDFQLIDALWMGCPVMTLEQGLRGSSRAGSLLASATQEQFLTHRVEEYIDKTVALAKNTDDLSANRESLREAIAESQLVDANGFVKGWYSTIKTLV